MPFKIYRSSAGSGKTFTLVKEYLRLALAANKPDSYKEILAVTFTNKAAEEMKSRVLKSLKNLAESDLAEDDMAQHLMDELELSESAITERAKEVLRHMLHHYSDLSISTIDKFSHKLIRTFSQDFGLSVNFEVELDSDQLTQSVLEELLNRVGAEPILTEALIGFVESTTENEKGWNIDKRLSDFIKVLYTEESRYHLEQLKKVDLQEFSRLRKQLKAELFRAKSELRNNAKSALQKSADLGLSAASYYYGKSGIFSYMRKLANGELETPGNRINFTIENDNWYGSKATVEEQNAIDSIKLEWIRVIELAKNTVGSIKYHQVVFDHIYGVALLDEMHRILVQIQKEEETVHISEFNHMISDVVMTESAPFIYERIGSRYRHFLIDEFQDTSILQWFNLLPLIDESLAHDNLCLIVGDAKQSIYRWRGGDVQQFQSLPAIHQPAHISEKLGQHPQLNSLFESREAALRAAKMTINLGSNFRSKATVVEFNNRLFEWLQPRMPENLRSMYDGTSQQVKKTEAGQVTVGFLRPDVSGNSWPDYDLHVQNQLLTWIAECEQDEYALGDIAIIFRTNKKAVKTALFLIENGFNVVSNESLLINGSSKVRLLVNLAEFYSNPNNATNIAELLENLASITGNYHQVSEYLMNSNGGRNITFTRDLLSASFPEVNWSGLGNKSPYSFFSYLIHGLFEGSCESHLSFFLNEVLSFTQAKRKSMEAFLLHWIEKRDSLSIALEKKENAISILTIHKSKGLEFPVVIHPYADYPNKKGVDHIWSYIENDDLKPLDRIRIANTRALESTPFEDDRLSENALGEMDMFNEMYVALTRAQERLYISGKLFSNPAKDADPKTAIQYVRKHLLDEYELKADQLELTLGSSRKIKQALDPQTELNLHSTGDPHWKDRVSIAQPGAALSATTEEASARLRGIAIHDALAKIRTEADVDQAVNALVEEGRIGELDATDIIQHISNLLAHPDLKPLYSKEFEIRNEADIQLANGRWLRPDRVVTKNNAAWVIDYKTGEERGTHRQQIEDYKYALSLFGFEHIQGMLVYVDSENVVRI